MVEMSSHKSITESIVKSCLPDEGKFSLHLKLYKFFYFKIIIESILHIFTYNK